MVCWQYLEYGSKTHSVSKLLHTVATFFRMHCGLVSAAREIKTGVLLVHDNSVYPGVLAD